jgi:hypothetical protein
MSGNSSSSGAGSNTGGGFLTSGSESGNISGGVSGNVSGNVNVEIEAIKARVKELNEECTVDTPTGPKRDWNIYIYQIPEREGLASRLFICWQELGYDKDRGYTIEDAYKECGVDTTNAV